MAITFLRLFLLTILQHAAAAAAVRSALLAPNMSSCHLPSDLPSAETPFNCCAPSSDYPLRLFTPNSTSSSPLRVRRAAHLVDTNYAEKLALAYTLMKALPPDDPRSFMQQANIHCAYCNKVYSQMDFPDLLFQVHGSWLFFPFHRWYLYFHERILAKLLGDDDFAIPFWNYDHPDGAAIPQLYSTYNLTLIDSLRDTHDNASAPAAIDFAGDSNHRSSEKQLRENANSMFRSLIRDAGMPQEFFGGSYKAGESFVVSSGTVEKRPHNSVHNWLGQKSQVGWKDMGSLYAAARDPVFYAHHALLDRLWEEWRAIPGHDDIMDEDYLDTEFAFYNEEAELVRVKVRDAFNTSEMGYVYEEVENLWKEAIPERRSVGEAELIGNESMCVEGEEMTGPCTVVMERDLERVGKGEEEYMEVRVEHAEDEMKEIDIYINLPSADAETDTGCEEFYDVVSMKPKFNVRVAGQNIERVGVGRTISTYKTRSSVLRERLAALELTEATRLVVTLVPRSLNTSASQLILFHTSLVITSSSLSTS